MNEDCRLLKELGWRSGKWAWTKLYAWGNPGQYPLLLLLFLIFLGDPVFVSLGLFFCSTRAGWLVGWLVGWMDGWMDGW